MWWKKLTGKEPDLGTTDVESFGKLAWLDKVVISNATFKLGSGTAKKITPTVSGDTATFTVDIPG